MHRVRVLTQYFVSLTTGPKPLPKRVPQTVRSSAFSFNFQYLLLSLSYSTSCLHLLPRLLVPSGFQGLYSGVYFTCNFATFLNVSMEHAVFPEESIVKCPRHCPPPHFIKKMGKFVTWVVLFMYFIYLMFI